jgi:uncharacterized membrane protein YqhA
MSMAADEPRVPRDAPGLRPLPQLIFASRWLQLPLYLGLIVAQGVYVILILKELWHLVPDRRGDDLESADHGHRRRLRDLRFADGTR